MSIRKVLESDRLRDRFYLRTVLFLGIGALLGTILAKNCAGQHAATPDLHALLSSVSARPLFRSAVVSVLFSLLVYLCSLLSIGAVAVPMLFCLKGFCVSYAVFACTSAGESAGFLAALCLLLFHSILLLPVQLYGAWLLSRRLASQERAVAEKKVLLLFVGSAVPTILSEQLLATRLCDYLLTHF